MTAGHYLLGSGDRYYLVPNQKSHDLRRSWSRHVKTDAVDAEALARIGLMAPDGQDQLVQVCYTHLVGGVPETVTADYTYSYQGLRVKKVVSRVSSVGSSVEETYFIYDLSGNLIEERSGPDPRTWLRRYAWGPGGRLAMVEVSAACDPVNYGYFVARTTLRGDVVGLVKAAAGFAQAATYRYDPWGRSSPGPDSTNPSATRATSTTRNRGCTI